MTKGGKYATEPHTVEEEVVDATWTRILAIAACAHKRASHKARTGTRAHKHLDVHPGDVHRQRGRLDVDFDLTKRGSEGKIRNRRPAVHLSHDGTDVQTQKRATM